MTDAHDESHVDRRKEPMPGPYQHFALDAGARESVDLDLLSQELAKDDVFHKSGRISRTLARGDQLTVVLTVMKKDCEIHEHSTPGPVVVTVLSGSVLFVFDRPRDEVPLRRGSAVICSKDASHGVRALEDSAFLIVADARKCRPRRARAIG
jgi:quercetin dioxygenase-like cupin family protein